jgi:hypothetical protein
MNSIATMPELASAYLLARDVTPKYASHIRRTAAKLAASGITPQNIGHERVNAWLSSLAASGIRATTLVAERQMALGLWRHGIETGTILAPVRLVRKPRVPGRLVRAFTRADLNRLVKRFTECDFGAFRCGLPRNRFLLAWTNYVYETGARFEDAYSLSRLSLIEGGVAWVASKNQQPVFRALSASTRALVDEIAAKSPDERVFGWVATRRQIHDTIRQAYIKVGVGPGRTQWLRRAGATHCEAVRPGSGREYLGHSAASAGLAEKHYIDRTQITPLAPNPVFIGAQPNSET